jgi:protein-disulfide isomerase
LVTFLFAFTAMAEDKSSAPQTGAKDDAGITRQQATDILNELRQIRQLLERQSKSIPGPLTPTVPQTGKLRLDGGFSLGSSDASVAIVEFTDYECQFCRLFENTTFAEIRKKYIDTGKVRFVVRDFPLNIHSNAMRAAEAAHCANDQGKFWPMHDALFSETSKLDEKGLTGYAETLKLDVGAFRSCIESGKHKQDIQNDMQVATSLQIMATPSFLIGKTTDEDVEGAIIMGAQPLSAFEAKLKELHVSP